MLTVLGCLAIGGTAVIVLPALLVLLNFQPDQCRKLVTLEDQRRVIVRTIQVEEDKSDWLTKKLFNSYKAKERPGFILRLLCSCGVKGGRIS